MHMIHPGQEELLEYGLFQKHHANVLCLRALTSTVTWHLQAGFQEDMNIHLFDPFFHLLLFWSNIHAKHLKSFHIFLSSIRLTTMSHILKAEMTKEECCSCFLTACGMFLQLLTLCKVEKCV